MKPEEEIRQHLVEIMIRDLGYPKEMISIERRLSSLPHLINKKVPHRRFDVLCFAKNLSTDHAIYPLLMLECKAHPITKKAVDQIIGYNDYVSSFFIGIVNHEKVLIGYKCKERGDYQFFEGIPHYLELVQMVTCTKEK